MNRMIDDRVKDRLRKLFAVAENDASSEGEIDNALRAAKILMNQHQIERGDIKEEDDGTINLDDITYGDETRQSMYASICTWESYLCHFITEFVAGSSFYLNRGVTRRTKSGMASSHRGGKTTLITFYGPTEDVRLCCDIWDEVTLMIHATAVARYGSSLARGYAAAYAEGFGYGLWKANHQEAKKLTEASKSDKNALVVVNRSLAIQDGSKRWLEENRGVKLSKGRRTPSQAFKNLGAFQQGKEDGSSYKPAARRTAGYLER